MKRSLSIIILTVILLAAEACVSNSEKSASNETPVVNANSSTLAEKRAKLESQRVARTEKRLADLEARVKAGPTYANKAGKLVYHKAEVDPTFTGGEKALEAYLHDNLQYPKDAEEQGLEGTVFVDFVVLSTGSVNEVEVIKDGDYDIDQSFIDEAVRVIINMPNWTPGTQHGKAVDVKFSVPVTFKMI